MILLVKPSALSKYRLVIPERLLADTTLQCKGLPVVLSSAAVERIQLENGHMMRRYQIFKRIREALK